MLIRVKHFYGDDKERNIPVIPFTKLCVGITGIPDYRGGVIG